MSEVNIKHFNPISYSDQVLKQFLRYQLTGYKITDKGLNEQLKELINFDKPNNSPLIKGPYVSIKKPFKKGTTINELIDEGIFHPGMMNIAPFPNLYKHQENAIRAITSGSNSVISTGTGSGKTESFLLPIINYCLNIRDGKIESPKGINAILIYPMNALANDQIDRIRDMLAGSGITFGIYTGQTPRSMANVEEMPEILSKPHTNKEYKNKKDKSNIRVVPFEERLTRDQIAENPPNILITNVYQLEYLLTREKDLQLFVNAPLKYLVLDEAHTYSGVMGAETAVLIRRIIALSHNFRKLLEEETEGMINHEVISIGTSATLANKETDANDIHEFLHRLTGCDRENVEVMTEIYDEHIWDTDASLLRISKDIVEPQRVYEKLMQDLENIEDYPNWDKRTEAAVLNVLKYLEPDMRVRGNWQKALFDYLKQLEIMPVIASTLEVSQSLYSSMFNIYNKLERMPTDEGIYEILLYLALGGLAERDGAPLIRSTLHYFVQGMQGVVAVINAKRDGAAILPDPKLYFSGEKALEVIDEDKTSLTGILPVLTCSTCGQHYFESFVSFLDEAKEGEELKINDQGITSSSGEMVFATSDPNLVENLRRVLLTDRIISTEEEEDVVKGVETVFYCTRCATLHQNRVDNCQKSGCGNSILVPMYKLTQTGDNISTCVGCNTRSRREPFRKLNAIQVADNFILAQELVANLPKISQKLIMFADSRQDAAFQAAWMADRARAYRFRHLMFLKILEEENSEESKISRVNDIQSGVSIGDIAQGMETYFNDNKIYRDALLPEIFGDNVQDSFSQSARRDMKNLILIRILMELTYTYKQISNLEGWGLLKVIYEGVHRENEILQGLASKYQISDDDLISGIELILDHLRKNKNVSYSNLDLYNKNWSGGDTEILRRFIPFNLVQYGPRALVVNKRAWKEKLRELSKQKTKLFFEGWISGFYNPSGTPTTLQNFIGKWESPKLTDRDDIIEFLKELWKILVDELKILKKVNITQRDKKIPTGQVYHIDLEKIGLQTIENYDLQFYQCKTCLRIVSTIPSNEVCSRYRCSGKLELFELEDDNYDVELLKSNFILLTPKEHTAQVPVELRSKYEEIFKQGNPQINTLVATPTLELGIDIGSLDVVLMRNIPPVAANYWQRAGRAGRRNRTGVIFSYCRSVSHDSYFFTNPDRLLSGLIFPPLFNLKNEVMIKKHIRSTIFSCMLRYSIDNEDNTDVKHALSTLLPTFINSFVYEDDKYITDISKLEDFQNIVDFIKTNEDEILKEIQNIFRVRWPKSDIEVTKEEFLKGRIEVFVKEIVDVMNIFKSRFLWAKQKYAELSDLESKRELTKEETKNKYHFNNMYKGMTIKKLENYTLNVYGYQGLIPSYSNSQGDYIATATATTVRGTRLPEYVINRSGSMALREFSPGYALYANGGKFSTNFFEFRADTENEESLKEYRIVGDRIYEGTEEILTSDIEAEQYDIRALPLSNVQLKYLDRVNSDKDDVRRAMPIKTIGKPLDEHGEGLRFTVGEMEFSYLRNQRVLMVNIGPKVRENSQQIIGYPICMVCGATRSPFASDKELESFREYHKKQCGKTPDDHSIYLHTMVDGIIIHNLEFREDYLNFIEALLVGMAVKLSINREDMGYFSYEIDDDRKEAFLYDPMRGGSGIITQLIDSWSDVVDMSIELLEKCENACDTSCYKCLKTYWNATDHEYLDRHRAIELLTKIKSHQLTKGNNIPSTHKKQISKGEPTNFAEALFQKILKDHKFPEFETQREIQINMPKIKNTIPDFLYEEPSKNIKLAIYIDGLSKKIHGNMSAQIRDRMIDKGMKDLGWDVLRIPFSQLSDDNAMKEYMEIISYSF